MGKRTRVVSRLLVVDRDALYGEWLSHHLGVLCPDATVNRLHPAELERLNDLLKSRDCDVLILSAPFGSSPEDPKALGLDLLRDLREQPTSPAVIVIAEDGNELTAVRSLQLGAADYIPKRLLTPERLKTAVRIALRRLEKRVARRLAHLANEEGRNAAAQQDAARAAAALEAAGPGQEAALLEDAAKEHGREAAALDETGREGGKEEGQEGAASDKGDASAEKGGASPEKGGSSRATGEPLPATDLVAGYVIRALIGDSEKAAVYLATSATLGRNIALKVSKTVRDDAAGRQFLEREYTAIVAIRSPSVVQIHDYGVHNGHEYLAMEYLPRGDLKARMHQGITEYEALRFVEQIGMALQVVHDAGLLHRDLKPANVMLRENGEVALIDFGLARSLDGNTQSTRTGVLRGSPYYMSPEQALGELLDARSDFYSLGVILFEMLTGRRPFVGSSAMEVLQQHVNAPTPPLPAALSHLEPLLNMLLAKSRDARFSNAREVVEAAVAARLALTDEPRSTAA